MQELKEDYEVRDEPNNFQASKTWHETGLTRKTSSIRRAATRRFSVLESTEIHHRNEDTTEFYGPYAHIRKQLDYNYHCNYKKERQWLQDSIIEDFLDKIHSTDVCTTPTEPWLIYTVGVQGVGKHYTIQTLVQEGKLPLLGFVSVDPDEIRRHLPEFDSYLQKSPDKVDALTGKEAGYIMEIMTLAAVQAGKNVIVDGCLQSPDWHGAFFDSLKVKYPQLKIAILYVTAPFDTILQRSAEVALEIGRSIPAETIHELLDQIPKSLEIIKEDVDYFCELSNTDELEIVTDGQDWNTFYQNFMQTCAYVPGMRKSDLGKLAEAASDEEMKEAIQAAVKLAPTLIKKRHRQRTFSVLISSEENHRADVPGRFYGQFSHIRAGLDYSYHAHYTRERQSLQDAIISDMLNSAVITDVNGDLCTTPTEPWIVFSAGAMGAGKTYTMNKLVQEGRFPLLAFVMVDPDEIRRHLPEFHLYVENSPELAGELTRKESGLIAEILTMAGLHAGKNVMVDGSLRDSEWYKIYFAKLKEEFPIVRHAIIHVTAPREAVFQRAAERALQTGRVVPRETLEMALDQVPKSVKILAPLVDYFCELNNAPNAPDIELVTEGETWESFEAKWQQTCAWVPSRRKMLQSSQNATKKLVLGRTKVN